MYWSYNYVSDFIFFFISYLNTKKKNTSKYIKIINSEKTEENNILKDITADGISHFKYALVTSVEVEKVFLFTKG